jgi:hypothetical protein
MFEYLHHLLQKNKVTTALFVVGFFSLLWFLIDRWSCTIEAKVADPFLVNNNHEYSSFSEKHEQKWDEENILYVVRRSFLSRNFE